MSCQLATADASNRSCLRRTVAAILVLLVTGGVPTLSAPPEKDAGQKADRAQLLKTFIDEFVEITPGKGKFPQSFDLGSSDGPGTEQPVTKVTLRENFSIARYEVPQNLYTAVMGSNPSRWTGPRNSVELMDFAEAVKFCERITKMLRDQKLLTDDEEIRLPTESEWEYCCRAGTKTRFSFGDDARNPGDTGKKATLLDAFGWHTGNAAGNDPPVGALKPNAWGLYDMHGYLWEFVLDDWNASHSGVPSDGSARRINQSENRHVVRGGSWRESFELLTSTSRAAVDSSFKRDDLGFRCVRAKVRK